MDLSHDLQNLGVPVYQMKADSSTFVTAWSCRVSSDVGKGFLKECRCMFCYYYEVNLLTSLILAWGLELKLGSYVLALFSQL